MKSRVAGFGRQVRLKDAARVVSEDVVADGILFQ
jgi:hypothetical protein